MDNVKNKINIIKKLLTEIERENKLSEILRTSPHYKKTLEDDFSVEQVYFDFIKFIIDQDNLPEDVCGIKIRVNKDNKIYGYEFVCINSNILPPEKDIEIIWD